MQQNNTRLVQPGAKKGADWKIVTIGGASGIFLGTAAAVAAHTLASDDEAPVDDNVDQETVEQPVTAAPVAAPVEHVHHVHTHFDVDMATGEYDDMSFEDAFAAARAEVGPGGSFVWHGGIYGTFYEDEWNAMTPEERADFTHDAVLQHTGEADVAEVADIDGVEGVEDQGTIEIEYDGVPEDEAVPAVEDERGAEAQEIEAEINFDDADFQILGVEAVDIDGTMANVGLANIDNQDVYFIDINSDEVFDYAATDSNQNGEFDSDEIVDISSAHITVGDFSAAAEVDAAPAIEEIPAEEGYVTETAFDTPVDMSVDGVEDNPVDDAMVDDGFDGI